MTMWGGVHTNIQSTATAQLRYEAVQSGSRLHSAGREPGFVESGARTILEGAFKKIQNQVYKSGTKMNLYLQ